MLYYDRIDRAESADANETSSPRQFIICHFWYFIDKGFKFQSSTCNRYYDILIMFIDLISIAILNIDGTDFCYITDAINK